jgi:hypothetical protein
MAEKARGKEQLKQEGGESCIEIEIAKQYGQRILVNAGLLG